MWRLVSTSAPHFDARILTSHVDSKVQPTKSLIDLSSLEPFDPTGPVDYLDKSLEAALRSVGLSGGVVAAADDFEDANAHVEQHAGYTVSENLQNRSFRAALLVARWNSTGETQTQAAECYEMDYEYAQTIRA